MRYEGRSYRSQSYLMMNKENKENADTGNLHPHPLNKLKLHQKAARRVSNASTDSTLLPTYPMQAPILSAGLPTKTTELPDLKKQHSFLIASDYSADILESLCDSIRPNGCFLQAHGITASLRSKMVDWMIEVLSSYKMSEETFFRSVRLMDCFLKRTDRTQELKQLHLIGVAAMFSGAKYEEIHPIRLSVMHQKIARRKFRRSQILEKEAEIINALEFQLEEATIYDIVKHAAYEINLCLTLPLQTYFHSILLYLSKMVLFSYELAENDTKLLAAAVYFIGLKTLQQVAKEISPQETLSRLGRLLRLQEEEIVQVSRQVLQLAKNFSKVYPSLGNLKKFNKFEYSKQ